MKSQAWVYAAAGYNVALAVFHLGFWLIFRWREDLPKLHPVNRGVMQVMNIMLIFVFLVLAGLQMLLPAEMSASALGRLLMAGLTAFWLLRAILQPIFWSKMPGATNAAFISLFMLGAGLHALAIKT